MAVLIVGLIVFLGVHLIRVAAPAWRDGMVARYGAGPFKGLYALASAIGFVLIIWGFSLTWAGAVAVYVPADGMRHVTALFMVFALILAVASVLPAGRIKRTVRHPLLIATILFAVGHLLANGDSAGIVLFGAFLIWAVIDLLFVVRRPPAGSSAPAVSMAGDIGAVIGGLVLTGLLIGGLHEWLIGVSPLG
jgi:uncharacterized membrane protein